MDDLRERMSQATSGTPSPDALQQTLARVRRHERREKTLVIAVAALVAIVGVGGTIFALRGLGSKNPEPAGPIRVSASGMVAMWPQGTLPEIKAAQQSSDQGSSLFPWQTSASKVAFNFATDVLGWRPSNVAVSTLSGGEVTATISQPPPACPTPSPGSHSVCMQREETLTLSQLATKGTGGIWSVVEAQGHENIGVNAGSTVSLGQRISISTDLPDGTQIGSGTTFVSGCQATEYASTSAVHGGVASFTVAQGVKRTYQLFKGGDCPTSAQIEPTGAYVWSIYLMPPPLYQELINPATYFWEAMGGHFDRTRMQGVNVELWSVTAVPVELSSPAATNACGTLSAHMSHNRFGKGDVTYLWLNDLGASCHLTGKVNLSIYSDAGATTLIPMEGNGSWYQVDQTLHSGGQRAAWWYYTNWCGQRDLFYSLQLSQHGRIAASVSKPVSTLAACDPNAPSSPLSGRVEK